MINPQLDAYIKSEREKGKSDQEIASALVTAGWPQADVSNAMMPAGQVPPPPAPAPAFPPIPQSVPAQPQTGNPLPQGMPSAPPPGGAMPWQSPNQATPGQPAIAGFTMDANAKNIVLNSIKWYAIASVILSVGDFLASMTASPTSLYSQASYLSRLYGRPESEFGLFSMSGAINGIVVNAVMGLIIGLVIAYAWKTFYPSVKSYTFGILGTPFRLFFYPYVLYIFAGIGAAWIMGPVSGIIIVATGLGAGFVRAKGMEHLIRTYFPNVS